MQMLELLHYLRILRLKHLLAVLLVVETLFPAASIHNSTSETTETLNLIV